jgi:X-X-X-Leu-X-X-Gly heptad repeat protein
VQRFGNPSGAAGDAGEGVVGPVDRHLEFHLQAAIEPHQEGAAAGEGDSLFHDVGDELGRRLLDRGLDQLDDGADRLRDGVAQLDRRDLDRLRQAGQQVASPQRDPDLFVERVGGAGGDLGVLGRPLADDEVVIAPAYWMIASSISSPATGSSG